MGYELPGWRPRLRGPKRRAAALAAGILAVTIGCANVFFDEKAALSLRAAAGMELEQSHASLPLCHFDPEWWLLRLFPTVSGDPGSGFLVGQSDEGGEVIHVTSSSTMDASYGIPWVPRDDEAFRSILRPLSHEVSGKDYLFGYFHGDPPQAGLLEYTAGASPSLTALTPSSGDLQTLMDGFASGGAWILGADLKRVSGELRLYVLAWDDAEAAYLEVYFTVSIANVLETPGSLVYPGATPIKEEEPPDYARYFHDPEAARSYAAVRGSSGYVLYSWRENDSGSLDVTRLSGYTEARRLLSGGRLYGEQDQRALVYDAEGNLENDFALGDLSFVYERLSGGGAALFSYLFRSGEARGPDGEMCPAYTARGYSLPVGELPGYP